MRLRPVNAIFYEPKSKFIVIYQNGQLWQLPRMKVDINSWRNRKAYKGTKTALYLNKDQKIKDAKLSKILRTEDFPSTLANMTLPTFESWWLANAYEWLKAKDDDNNLNANPDPKANIPASATNAIKTTANANANVKANAAASNPLTTPTPTTPAPTNTDPANRRPNQTNTTAQTANTVQAKTQPSSTSPDNNYQTSKNQLASNTKQTSQKQAQIVNQSLQKTPVQANDKLTTQAKDQTTTVVQASRQAKQPQQQPASQADNSTQPQNQPQIQPQTQPASNLTPASPKPTEKASPEQAASTVKKETTGDVFDELLSDWNSW